MDSHDLIERYSALCEAADRKADLGWRSPREDGQKRRFTMTADVIDRFADYVFGGIGFESHSDYFDAFTPTDGQIRRRPTPTAEQRDQHRRKILGQIQNLTDQFRKAGVPPETWMPLITADNVVGGLLVAITIHDQRVILSSHTLRVALRSLLMRSALGSVPASVLEIGGGHGRFVRDVLKLAPGTRITYCDLPFNLLLAARYLSRVFPGDVHLAWDDAPIPDTARITIVPPWRLAEVPYPIDACCNFLSFQHMTMENLAYYGGALRHLGVASIYHINRQTSLHDGEVPLDDYPFRDAYETVSRRLFAHATTNTWINGVAQPPGNADQIEEVLRLKR